VADGLVVDGVALGSRDLFDVFLGYVWHQFLLSLKHFRSLRHSFIMQFLSKIMQATHAEDPKRWLFLMSRFRSYRAVNSISTLLSRLSNSLILEPLMIRE